MGRQRLSRTVGVVGVLLLGVVGVLSAQAGQGAAPSGMAELLAEVRGLRADVNPAAGASMRMQVLVARLSLQQRINVVGRQLPTSLPNSTRPLSSGPRWKIEPRG
jgi:hypothetical protein